MTESFTYDHLNRLTEIWLGNIKTGWFDYDPYGRMIRKTADNRPVFASAVYNITAKPHAIDAAKVWSGVFPNDDMDITYTAFDKVKTIAEGNNTLAYTYGYDRQRIFMEEHANGIIRTKRYVGGCEFMTLTEDNTTTETTLTYLSSPIGIFAVVEHVDNDEALHFILKDHLGSWTTITDCQGNIEQELSFDAWGNRRNPETWHSYSQLPEPMFDRGFTGHEHLYAFGLINMNGRMYDPLMSSFLSVDAYVQSPDNSQNFNRYAYCLNNPLKYVDPTGWRMVGGGVGNTTQGPSGWGKNLYPVYEPRDLKNLQLSEDFVLTLWRHGNTFGGNNKEDGGGGADLLSIGGSVPITKGGWYKNGNGQIQWSSTISSQKELNKQGIIGDYLGHTFKDDQYYYSLLGYKIDLSENDGINGRIAPLIDEAFIKWEQYRIDMANCDPFDYFDESVQQKWTDFKNIVAYDYNRGGKLQDHSFNLGPIIGHLLVGNTSNSMSARIVRFDLEKTRPDSNKGFGHVNYPDGYDINFVSKASINDSNPRNSCTVILIIPPSHWSNFKSRYISVFPNH